MKVKYRCTNEDCPRYGELREVPKNKTAECECGWFMESVL